MSNDNGDLEAPLNLSTQDDPDLSTQDDPELKWPFVRKVYLIVITQFVITVAVAAAFAFVQPIFNFFSNPWAGWGFYILAIIVLIIVLLALIVLKDNYPYNFILLGIATLCIGFFLGLETTVISGVVIVEAGITIIAVVLTLLAYTFWASWRGQDFGLLVPSLLSLTVTVGLYIIYQIYFPMGSIVYVICSGLVVLTVSVVIVYFTDGLFDADNDYILASVVLYFCLGAVSVCLRLAPYFLNNA
ncbi:hypothetical protein C2S51_021900 [Perilla frutescens var. frutescens]|nr:hypothetical protein C2S51_021900 [Perilla frutescens var. frutescens]